MLVSIDGSMVGVHLGTRLVKVNVSKIGKDHTAVEDVDVPLDPAALASADNTPVHIHRGETAGQEDRPQSTSTGGRGEGPVGAARH